MPIGFRKSLFGFNCDDVMNYIEVAQKKHAENEITLKTKIEELNESISSLQNNIAKISNERDGLSAKVKEFDEKYEEIDRLSQNIGKLYLVAQSNAQAIMNNSTQSSALASAEIEKNMTAISETQDTLDDIRREMIEISNNFSAKLEELVNSLNETRENISNKTLDTEQRTEQFAAVVKMLEE